MEWRGGFYANWELIWRHLMVAIDAMKMELRYGVKDHLGNIVYAATKEDLLRDQQGKVTFQVPNKNWRHGLPPTQTLPPLRDGGILPALPTPVSNEGASSPSASRAIPAESVDTAQGSKRKAAEMDPPGPRPACRTAWAPAWATASDCRQLSQSGCSQRDPGVSYAM